MPTAVPAAAFYQWMVLCLATAAKQAVERANRLYDSLFQSYHDKLMDEREYTELRRQYRADGAAAQERMEALERQRRDEQRQAVENPWLTTCGKFREDTELTEDMAHALIDRVEVDADKRISITLRYRDEYRALCLLLGADGEAVPARWLPPPSMFACPPRTTI